MLSFRFYHIIFRGTHHMKENCFIPTHSHSHTLCQSFHWLEFKQRDFSWLCFRPCFFLPLCPISLFLHLFGSWWLLPVGLPHLRPPLSAFCHFQSALLIAHIRPTYSSPLPVLSLCQVARRPNDDIRRLHKLHRRLVSLTSSGGLMALKEMCCNSVQGWPEVKQSGVSWGFSSLVCLRSTQEASY